MEQEQKNTTPDSSVLRVSSSPVYTQLQKQLLGITILLTGMHWVCCTCTDVEHSQRRSANFTGEANLCARLASASTKGGRKAVCLQLSIPLRSYKYNLQSKPLLTMLRCQQMPPVRTKHCYKQSMKVHKKQLTATALSIVTLRTLLQMELLGVDLTELRCYERCDVTVVVALTPHKVVTVPQ